VCVTEISTCSGQSVRVRRGTSKCEVRECRHSYSETLVCAVPLNDRQHCDNVEECKVFLSLAHTLPMLPCAHPPLTPLQACFPAESHARGTEQSNPSALSAAQLTNDPRQQHYHKHCHVCRSV